MAKTSKPENREQRVPTISHAKQSKLHAGWILEGEVESRAGCKVAIAASAGLPTEGFNSAA
jgi:hypothetical protein